jgi:hypothetical protein
MPSDAPVTTNDRRDTATARHAEVSPTDSAVIGAKNKVERNAYSFRQSLTCPSAFLCSELRKLFNCVD